MPPALALAAFVCWTLLLGACRPVDEATRPVALAIDSTGAAEPAGDSQPFLDPNLATVASLTALPGMSDSVALAVIAGRPYNSMLALEKVLTRHLSAEWRDSLYTLLWMPLDLNTASSDEILLIPGVDTRVRYELEEHRPYADALDFRSRIGELLGPAEAARIERYITLP